MTTYFQHATNHILAAIESDGFNGCDYNNPCETEKEKAEFSYGCFMSEMKWRVDQAGMKAAVNDWLSGLALNIAFYNHEILENAEKWGGLPENASEFEQDIYLKNYFPFMGTRLIALWRNHGLI